MNKIGAKLLEEKSDMVEMMMPMNDDSESKYDGDDDASFKIDDQNDLKALKESVENKNIFALKCKRLMNRPRWCP